MITSHLFEISAMIEAGLGAKRTPEEAPRPAAPELEETLDMGEPETHIDPGVAKHYEQMRQEKKEFDSAQEILARKSALLCSWVCPSTCRNCLVKNCQDRLAGTPDVD